jgi:hypothetical protein
MPEPGFIHPSSVGDITPTWLTKVLHDAGALDPSITIDSLTPRRIGEGVGIMGQLHATTLDYSGPAGNAPSSVVVKMPSAFEDNRQQGVNLGMYEAEARFYNELAPQSEVGLPEIYYSEIVSGTADFTIVMEDLSYLEMVDQTEGMTEEQAGAAVRVLADVHAAWWGKVETPELDWIPASAGPRIEMVAEMVPQLVPIFLERFSERLPEGGEAHAHWFSSNILAAYRTMAASSPMTLIHSDYRVENIMFGDPAKDEVVIIDWQGMARGPGLYDVAYLLSGSMVPDVRRATEQSIVATYVERLASHGIDYDSAAAWDHYRLGNTVGGIATSVFAGASLDLANERGFELIATMAERHFGAALDLDSAALVV